jgi:hypothetical protein
MSADEVVPVTLNVPLGETPAGDPIDAHEPAVVFI